MNKRMAVTMTLLLVLAGLPGIRMAAAQETSKTDVPQVKSMDSYNVEFTVNELENGKKINSRTYSMQIPNDPIRGAQLPWTEWKRLRVGSQVPIPAGEKGFNYKDVGMDIDCRYFLMENGKLTMATIWEYSSLGGEQGHEMSLPVFRHVRSEVETVVSLDKPTVISEVDDVASTHRYSFEVKVTKIVQ